MKTFKERTKFIAAIGTEVAIGLVALGFVLNKVANDEPQNAVAGAGFGLIALIAAGATFGGMSDHNKQENVRSMTQRDSN